jgi:hypothetical protein
VIEKVVMQMEKYYIAARPGSEVYYMEREQEDFLNKG